MLLAVTALTLLGGCTHSTTTTTARSAASARRWNVIGRVSAVVFGPDYSKSSGSASGPPVVDRQPLLPLGPLTITLADGRTLRARPRTPGQDDCPELLPEADKRALAAREPNISATSSEAEIDAAVRKLEHTGPSCIVIGNVGPDGYLRWFGVLASNTDGMATAEYVTTVGKSRTVTVAGYAFRLAPTTPLTCGSAGAPGRVTLGRIGPSQAIIDPTTGLIIDFVCLPAI